MICKRFFSTLIFLFVINFSFAETNIFEINSEKILYKSVGSIELNLHVYRPENFDRSKIYNCIVFFMEAVGDQEAINSLKDNQSILRQGE